MGGRQERVIIAKESAGYAWGKKLMRGFVDIQTNRLART